MVCKGALLRRLSGVGFGWVEDGIKGYAGSGGGINGYLEQWGEGLTW